MAQARRLLKDKARSVKQISEEIGYADAGYFTRQFRKLHDVTPKVMARKKCSLESSFPDPAL